MADLHPFRGARYNPALVPDLSSVLSPPYDVILPEERSELARSSPHNVIHLEYPVVSPAPHGEDGYSLASSQLREWLEQGVLTREASPAIYLCRHTFAWGGGSVTRHELYVRVRLEEWERGVVLPHEHTLAEPKQDRLNLLRACRANISPIYGLIKDDDSDLAGLLARTLASSPTFSVEGWRGSSFQVWAITDAEAIAGVRRWLAPRPIYIADGHHRYETALAYRDEVRSGARGSDSQAADFVLMALTDAADPGLIILPIHRLARHIDAGKVQQLGSRLEQLFAIDRWPLRRGSRDEDLAAAIGSLTDAGSHRPTFGVYGLEPDSILLCQPRDVEAIRGSMPPNLSDDLKSLDVSLLHWGVLGPMLGVSQEPSQVERHLSFTPHAVEAVDWVDRGEYQLAFLMNPTRVEQVMAVARAGDKMPQKSTYFYPKLPTGLVLNLLED